VLELRDITKKYHVFPAVDHVSFKIEPGEVLGYLGPNGAGKTTTIKMLAGLLAPTSGAIFLNNSDIRDDLCSYKKRLGYVPEQSDIYPHLSGYEYLLMIGRLREIPNGVLHDKIVEFLRLLGLKEDRDTPIGAYSKGMRQKVLISAALLHDPDILLLDEPLSGLDVTTAMVVRDLMKRLAESGKIVIYSSHVLEVTEKVCTRVIILHEGRVVANDSVENLRHLMHLPSLVEIFNQLVVHEDTEEVARGLVAAMKAG
jgi:ABC-2 type transport system ATP-binding protein